MTADEKTLDSFFDSVVGVLQFGDKSREFHFPRRLCFDGSCQRFGLSIGKYFYRACNWTPLLDLVTEFFDGAPDVTADWKARAQVIGLIPNDLHEILISIFLGSDSGHASIHNDYVSATKAKQITHSANEASKLFLRENPYPLEEIP